MTGPPALDGPSVRRALARGELSDEAFDALFPRSLHRSASRFWTPISVTARVVALLDAQGARRVLDAGSGVGKFCIVGAALAPHIAFSGVEHRPHLVREAERLADRLDLGNVRFTVGDATRCALEELDAAYFFNPFAENIAVDPGDHVDETVELSPARFRVDVQRSEDALQRAKHGFVLATYHGVGGRIPGAYDLVHAERAGTDRLRVWRKVRDGGPARHPFEDLLND